MNEQLKQAMADLEEETLLRLVHEGLDNGEDPQGILAACREGIMLVGQRFESGEYYISELVMAGEMFKEVMKLLPLETGVGLGSSRGQVVFGTVKGDIHNIGKDLVVGMLRATGYEVTDLGIDVPVAKFVEAVQQTGAMIVGLSGLLTTAFDSMKATIAALEEAELRPGVKVMIGDGSISEAVMKYTGADAFGTNAQDAVNYANQWAGVQGIV